MDSFKAVVEFANIVARIFVPFVTAETTVPAPVKPEIAFRIWLKCSAVRLPPDVAVGIEAVLPPQAAIFEIRLFHADAVMFVMSSPALILLESSLVQ